MRSGQDVLPGSATPLRAMPIDWVVSDGLGGAASGGAPGAPARPWHAHLVAAGPFGRQTPLLLKLDERVWVGEARVDLEAGVAAAQAGGECEPSLEEFSIDLGPSWR